jgi:hypothetical protein
MGNASTHNDYFSAVLEWSILSGLFLAVSSYTYHETPQSFHATSARNNVYVEDMKHWWKLIYSGVPPGYVKFRVGCSLSCDGMEKEEKGVLDEKLTSVVAAFADDVATHSKGCPLPRSCGRSEPGLTLTERERKPTPERKKLEMLFSTLHIPERCGPYNHKNRTRSPKDSQCNPLLPLLRSGDFLLLQLQIPHASIPAEAEPDQ